MGRFINANGFCMSGKNVVSSLSASKNYFCREFQMQFDRFLICLHEILASPTRRLCMEYNKKIIAAKLNPSGDNSEYQEEAENDIEDDDDVYMEQNFTDVSICVQP